MMNFWFLTAAILSACLCLLHVIGGGRIAARPLLATPNFDHVARFTNYYCWHLVTIAIALMAVAFAVAARPGASADLAILASSTAVTFGLWSIAMIMRFKLAPLQFGQWALFLPIGMLGVAGLMK